MISFENNISHEKYGPVCLETTKSNVLVRIQCWWMSFCFENNFIHSFIEFPFAYTIYYVMKNP